jgi:hypothetical protein
VVRLPTSHRKRVRLLWGSIAGAVVLGVAALIAFDRNSGHSLATPLDPHGVAKVYHAPKTVRATSQQKTAALSTLSAFVRSAIVRRNLASSWSLATAHMKQGTSRSDWLQGNLPVVPYPASAFRGAGYTLKYQYKGVLGYDVLVLPKETAAAAQKAGEQVYACELHEVHGRWLVDFCYPRKTL